MTPADRHNDPSRLTDTVRDELLRQLRRRGSEPGDGGDDPGPTPSGRWKGIVIAALAVLSAFVGREIQSGDWRSFIEHRHERRTQSSFVYAQTPVRVHETPDGNSRTVRMLVPGDAVWLGAPGPRTWVEVLDRSGKRIGYSSRTRHNLLPVRPTLPPPADTTAICGDSTPSFSVHASGTCAGRGGVLCWISYPARADSHLSKPFCRAVLPARVDEP